MHRWDPVARWPKGLVSPVRVDPSGRSGPTRGQAAGPRWRRVAPGWYVPSSAPRHLPEQRILEAAVRLPDGAAVTGWAACRMLGAGLVDGFGPDGVTGMPVPLALGRPGGSGPVPESG